MTLSATFQSILQTQDQPVFKEAPAEKPERVPAAKRTRPRLPEVVVVQLLIYGPKCLAHIGEAHNPAGIIADCPFYPHLDLEGVAVRPQLCPSGTFGGGGPLRRRMS